MAIFEQLKTYISKELLPISQAEKPTLGLLKEILQGIQFTQNDVLHLLEGLSIDESHPYSRNVLCNEESVEVMLARWTPNFPCHPHDHGNSYSAILVVDGCAKHQLYSIQDGELVCIHAEEKNAGDIILCAPHQIHSMGGSPNLLTLHLYMQSIENMLLFDMEKRVSFLVDGGSGAWLPVDDESQVMAKKEGYFLRADFAGAYV